MGDEFVVSFEVVVSGNNEVCPTFDGSFQKVIVFGVAAKIKGS